MDKNDLLYLVFEKHLFQFVTEEQDLDAFAVAIVEEYLTTLARQGVLVPASLRPVLHDDLLEEVMEMAHKKTYGHVSLLEYRQKNIRVIETYLKKSA